MQVGRFEIVRELGRGAQSVVYLARDPQLEREIAIKTLHFSRPDPSQNQVLLSEARTVGKLRHPNIVPIFEAGEEDGDVYLVFEYVPGKDLAQAIQTQGAMEPLRAATILRQVLDAIGAAHSEGVIHRDLKPSNILLDASGLVRVMDFGIAAKVSGAGEGQGEFSGTPAYMAPEYIERREISARTDVFAAGLIFYELLLGKRAIAGKNIYQIMYALAHQDIAIPRGGATGIDDRLADILYKALARKPESRYESAAQFRKALDEYLEPNAEPAAGGEGQQSTLEFLLRRMRHKSDFPALSESVGSINKIAASEKDSVNKLSNAILRDYSLTNKILRLVNSAYYRQSGGGSISTVSRAVLVLGFDAVRNLAITVLLYEHMQKSPAIAQLMDEFLKANFAALLARDLNRKAGVSDAEQAFICALFHSLGRLLSQYYFAEEAEAIRKLALQKGISDETASMQVLGISYTDLGIGVAKSWGFPLLIVNSMHLPPPGAVRAPATAEEKLQVLSGFANELCGVIASATPESRAKLLKQLTTRYADGVKLGDNQLEELIERSFKEVAQFASIVRVNVQTTPFGKQIRAWSGKAGGTQDAAAAAGGGDTAGLDGSVLAERGVVAAVPGPGQAGDDAARPAADVDAQSILAAGIQDISNTLVEEFKLNDILRIILETMYRAMGFQRVIFCVRDPKTNVMQGRFGFGPDVGEVLRAFRFSLQGKPDVFTAALSKGVDILISDINEQQIRARVPEWFRKSVPAETFVLLPLVIKSNPVAMIYADRPHANEIVIPEKELSLLRTLRNQAVLAIKQTS